MEEQEKLRTVAIIKAAAALDAMATIQRADLELKINGVVNSLDFEQTREKYNEVRQNLNESLEALSQNTGGILAMLLGEEVDTSDVLSKAMAEQEEEQE